MKGFCQLFFYFVPQEKGLTSHRQAGWATTTATAVRSKATSTALLPSLTITNSPITNSQSHCRRSRGSDQGLLPPRLPPHQRLHRLPPALPQTASVCHKSAQACVQVPSHTKVEISMRKTDHNLILSTFL